MSVVWILKANNDWESESFFVGKKKRLFRWVNTKQLQVYHELEIPKPNSTKCADQRTSMLFSCFHGYIRVFSTMFS